LNSGTEHFFVNVDSTDPRVEEEAAGLDPEVAKPHSLTRFLTLPTVIARANPSKKDPIINFAKSIVLTFDQYVQAAMQLKCTREEAAREKERKRGEKNESKQRKLAEREEENVRKVAHPEQAAWLKKQRAEERALQQAQRATKREEATREKAAKAVQIPGGEDDRGTRSWARRRSIIRKCRKHKRVFLLPARLIVPAIPIGIYRLCGPSPAESVSQPIFLYLTNRHVLNAASIPTSFFPISRPFAISTTHTAISKSLSSVSTPTICPLPVVCLQHQR
jgi:flagellar biosynthesis GTPase FlhF